MAMSELNMLSGAGQLGREYVPGADEAVNKELWLAPPAASGERRVGSAAANKEHTVAGKAQRKIMERARKKAAAGSDESSSVRRRGSFTGTGSFAAPTESSRRRTAAQDDEGIEESVLRVRFTRTSSANSNLSVDSNDSVGSTGSRRNFNTNFTTSSGGGGGTARKGPSVKKLSGTTKTTLTPSQVAVSGGVGNGLSEGIDVFGGGGGARSNVHSGLGYGRSPYMDDDEESISSVHSSRARRRVAPRPLPRNSSSPLYSAPVVMDPSRTPSISQESSADIATPAVAAQSSTSQPPADVASRSDTLSKPSASVPVPTLQVPDRPAADGPATAATAAGRGGGAARGHRRGSVGSPNSLGGTLKSSFGRNVPSSISVSDTDEELYGTLGGAASLTLSPMTSGHRTTRENFSSHQCGSSYGLGLVETIEIDVDVTDEHDEPVPRQAPPTMSPRVEKGDSSRGDSFHRLSESPGLAARDTSAVAPRVHSASPEAPNPGHRTCVTSPAPNNNTHQSSSGPAAYAVKAKRPSPSLGAHRSASPDVGPTAAHRITPAKSGKGNSRSSDLQKPEDFEDSSFDDVSVSYWKAKAQEEAERNARREASQSGTPVVVPLLLLQELNSRPNADGADDKHPQQQQQQQQQLLSSSFNTGGDALATLSTGALDVSANVSVSTLSTTALNSGRSAPSARQNTTHTTATRVVEVNASANGHPRLTPSQTTQPRRSEVTSRPSNTRPMRGFDAQQRSTPKTAPPPSTQVKANRGDAKCCSVM